MPKQTPVRVKKLPRTCMMCGSPDVVPRSRLPKRNMDDYCAKHLNDVEAELDRLDECARTGERWS